MSAPKTNLEEQEKKHKTPLLGMGASVLLALVLLVLLIGWVTIRGIGGNEDTGEKVDASAPVTSEAGE